MEAQDKYNLFVELNWLTINSLFVFTDYAVLEEYNLIKPSTEGYTTDFVILFC